MLSSELVGCQEDREQSRVPSSVMELSTIKEKPAKIYEATLLGLSES